MKVAVIGGDGFVGSAICRSLQTALCVTRSMYAEAKAGNYDVVVHAAIPSARYAASKDPAADFDQAVRLTHDVVQGWRYKRLVLVSTVSARVQRGHPYGRHRRAAEALCDPAKSTVVRLGPMYGPTLRKGVLVDLARGRPVYTGGGSAYGFLPVDFVGSAIAKHLLLWPSLVELMATDFVRLTDLADAIGSSSTFVGADVSQHACSAVPDCETPSAGAVVPWFLGNWTRLTLLGGQFES